MGVLQCQLFVLTVIFRSLRDECRGFLVSTLDLGLEEWAMSQVLPNLELEPPIENAWKSFLPTGVSARATAVVRAVELEGGPQGDSDDGAIGINGEGLSARLRASGRFAFRADEWAALRTRASAGRQAEWRAAREAELELEARLGSDLFWSVSHSSGTAGQAGCVVVVGLERAAALSAGMGGVGVDVEDPRRTISSAVRDRVVSQAEQRRFPNLTTLDFWVMKEAAYKATPENHGLVLPDFELRRWDATTGGEMVHRQTVLRTFRYPLPFGTPYLLVGFAISLL